MTENKSLILFEGEQTEETNVRRTEEIVRLPSEYKGYDFFYKTAKQGTMDAVELAETLIGNDPDSPDPLSEPGKHKNFAMHKYGVHLKLPDVPDLPKYIGYYSLAKFRYVLESLPSSYSPGYNPSNLDHYLGMKDPIDTVLSVTTLLAEQAQDNPPLRPIFKHFPVRELLTINISGKMVGNPIIWEAIKIARKKIYIFHLRTSKTILSWNQSHMIDIKGYKLT